ncbi:MAG: phosphatidylinositol mannoside acyltransferase [Egibacteraceae bacterium]
MRAGGAYRGSGQPGEPVDRNPGAVGRAPRELEPEGLRLRLVGLAWESAWELARWLPEPVVFATADLGGRLAYRFGRGLRTRIRCNLARVVSREQLDEAVRAAFRSYARYWVEAFRCADLEPKDLDRRTTTAGFEHLDEALRAGRGIIVLLAHHGSWDVAARWAEAHGYHIAVVVEVLRPRRLFDKFVALREAVGLEVVPLTKDRSIAPRLARVLAANHLAGLMSDRDLSSSGPVVTLFGERSRMPRGPVMLSQRTGAAIVPITMLQRPGRRWHLQVLPAVDVCGLEVAEAVQRCAETIEQLVRLAPEQWHVFSPVFLADQDGSGAPQRPARGMA